MASFKYVDTDMTTLYFICFLKNIAEKMIFPEP